MNTNGLLDQARVEIKLGDYGVAPATALADPAVLPRVQEYRRLTGSRMIPLDREDIRKRIPTADYHVSRKVDGEFTVLVYRQGHVYAINPGGTVRVGLPLENEAASLFDKAGVIDAMIAGELYVHREDRRPRVHDVVTVARQPQSKDDLAQLRFAAFDIVSLNGQEAGPSFAETWNTIDKLFDSGERVHPVEAITAASPADIEQQFAKWVDGEGAEGIVVRSDTAGLFKIKPRHTLDAVVIGFTESTEDRQGMLHDLLLAVMRHDGTFQVLSRVGGGFSDDDRRSFLSDLKGLAVESEYAEVNSDHVAYQMVYPQWVVEISCLDMISETTRGGPVNRMVLDFSDNGSQQYKVVRRLPLAAVISPQFLRRREDKSVHPEDLRIEQVSDRVEVPLVDRNARQLTLPASEVLRREVYTKAAKGETMVRKFVLWKTNKEEESDEYPAYVLHYTDFSPNRKTPLARDVRVSSSLEQMQTLWDEMKDANIKKGWELHANAAVEAARPAEKPTSIAADGETASKPAKKKAAKKAAVTSSVAKPSKKKATKKTAKKTSKKKLAPSDRTSAKKTKKKTG